MALRYVPSVSAVIYSRICVFSLSQTYYERAKICITPTKKGKQDIDEAHPCFTVKYLKNKPVRALKNDEFLKMVQAEQEGTSCEMTVKWYSVFRRFSSSRALLFHNCSKTLVGLLHITMGIDVMDPSNLSTIAATKYVDEVKELYR